MKSICFTASCLVLGFAVTAMGQANPAHQNVAGRGYRPPTARTYQRTAREHAGALNYYGKTYKALPKETVQEHLAEVKRNVEAAQKEFSKVDAETKKDPEVVKSLKIIHDHHAKALEMCKMAEGESVKDITDTAKLCECCEGMQKELEAAEAEHAKMMKHLKMEPLDAHTKPATK